jgi:ABC-type dipeptide/oligopeptide/nickel transport system permease subunit
MWIDIAVFVAFVVGLTIGLIVGFFIGPLRALLTRIKSGGDLLDQDR